MANAYGNNAIHIISGFQMYNLLTPDTDTTYTIKLANLANIRTDNITISGSLTLIINSITYYLISGVSITPNTTFVYNYPIIVSDAGNSQLQAWANVSGLDVVLFYQNYSQTDQV